MICGTGLVAKQLTAFKDRKDVLIFASGVSNSRETKEEAFEREEKLLLSFRGTKAKLVYFSTCSLFDPASQGSRYVLHKIRMEDLVRNYFQEHLIVRLPLLIAHSSNPYTFFNFIQTCIKNGTSIPVQSNAWRYIFDAAEIGFFIPLLMKEQTEPGMEINMAFNNGAPVPVLIQMFEKIMGKQAVIQKLEQGSFYEFDRNPFYSILPKANFNFDKRNYNFNLLEKYLRFGV